MSSIGRVQHSGPDVGAGDATPCRDRFRSAVAALDPGPLQDVLTAVAYARDEAARTGTVTAPPARWLAVVAAAERAVSAADARPCRAAA